jgi:methionyl-tRNA formyltransferase
MGETTLSAFESLLTQCDVLGIVRNVSCDSQSPDLVAQLARASDVSVFTDVSASSVEALVTRLVPDCVVVSSYNRILKQQTLARCRFINVHYSPLPKYRGRANVNWALINGEQFAAISIHVLAPRLDAGNILFQRTVTIHADDTVHALYDKLNGVQQENLGSTVVRFLGGFTGYPQDDTDATYGCTRVPDDGLIDWTASTQEIDRLVRALAAPFPGAYAFYEGRRLTIWKAAPLPDAPVYDGRVPGRVVSVSQPGGHVDVLTGDGVLRILEVQLQGEQAVPAARLIRSVKCSLSVGFPQLVARIEKLERLLESIMMSGSGDR